MRVLFYNWCPIEETEGGGIAVYQRNLLDFIENSKLDIDAFFLCSGFYYDNNKRPYIRKEETSYSVSAFSIVNSPVYAPMRAPDSNFYEMINDQTLKDLVDQFISKNGPFDVIHFHTLEGLSLNILSLKEKYNKTKFIYSIHNYTAICPNVMLWTGGGENCGLKKSKDCYYCMNRYNRPNIWFLKKSRELLVNGHKKLYYYSRGIKYVTRNYFMVKKKRESAVYQQYIMNSVDAINNYIDTVLAVSKRVAEVMASNGIKREKIQVSYIGTKFADIAVYKERNDSNKDPFGIVYMGYMREEKGFYFLLEALEEMDEKSAGGMALTFASKVTDRSAAKRVEKLNNKFRFVRLLNGYTHEDIPKILKDANLGVVPVLWEDNLPQVAIEMAASGVPVLASSFGGASEINNNRNFRFEGGNKDDFINKLLNIYNDRSLLNDYWKTCMVFKSMEDHVNELMKVYENNE